jgi:predicted nucleic acid-binding protein
LSFVDGIGYTLARKQGLTFLTGDPAFEGMQGVEFVR